MTNVNVDYLFPENKEKYIFLNNSSLFFSEAHLSYKIINNGIVLPHKGDAEYNCGVYDAHHSFIHNTGTGSVYNDAPVLNGTHPIKHIKEKVIFIGAFCGIYGHFITDSLRNMWFLNTKYFDLFKDYKLVYYSWGNFELSGNFKTILTLLNIRLDNLYEVTGATQFDEVVVPDPSFFATSCYDKTKQITSEYIDTIDFLKSRALAFDAKVTIFPRNIFLSCSHLKNKISIGEKKLDLFFEKEGFSVMHPENIDFIDMVHLLNKCKMMASTDGSSIHNCIFMNDESTLIVIPRANYTTTYQNTLNYVRLFNCYYVDSSLSIFTSKNNRSWGPFYYYVSEQLYSFFKKDIPKNYIKQNFYDMDNYIHISLKNSIHYDFDCDTIYSRYFFLYYSKYLKKDE